MAMAKAKPLASSGASCPGLIEAESDYKALNKRIGHPGLLAPASLKRAVAEFSRPLRPRVIRGFLPRPH